MSERTRMDLWASTDVGEWDAALREYPTVIEMQGVNKLPERDRWYHEEFSLVLTERRPLHVTLEELVKVTEWKMARGVWRARNLVLVRSNPEEEVVSVSTEAFATVPDHTAPIAGLSKLAGVGPATASAVVAAVMPELYPFFDEIVAAQIPQAEKLVFNLKYYKWYAEQLRARAAQLGAGWTPGKVEQALWSNAGGKAGVAANMNG